MARARGTNSLETKRKSEVVTVRLDPKLKYLAELAARRQRRPLSSYIEWAVEQSLNQVYPAYDPSDIDTPTFADVANSLWDIDEPDRFVRLALRYPDLLDHEEQRLWKLIRECGLMWRGEYAGPNREWRWKVQENSVSLENLRKHWETFCKVASGELDPSALPTYKQFDQKPTSGQDLDDEIPF